MQVQSPLNYPDCIQVPTMNDYPFKSQIEAIWGKSTGNDFSIAVTEVQKRWEWNNKSCLLTFSCPRRDAYEAVISTYYNLAKDKKIAEYRDKSPDANKVVLEVSKISGKGETFVKEVLNYLYWGSIDDTQDVSQAISLPISSQTKSEYREIPAEYKQTFGQTVTDSLGGLATTLKWAGVIAAVGIGAYALTQVNTTAKLLGRKTSGLSDDYESQLKELRKEKDKYFEIYENLNKIHKKKYGNIDISMPKTVDEKESERKVAAAYSEVQQVIREIHKIIKLQKGK